MTEKNYNECVRLYADGVYRFIIKNLRHEEDSKDVVQSSFEKLWINRVKVDIITAKNYLFTIAYNLMIDHIRKNKRIVLKEELPNDIRTTSAHSNTKRILEEALVNLSETQRSLIMLKDYEGYSYKEIGEITGLNESQVKVYMHRARLQLREYIVNPENVI